MTVIGTTVYFGATDVVQINAAGTSGHCQKGYNEDKRDGDQSNEPPSGRSTNIRISLNIPILR